MAESVNNDGEIEALPAEFQHLRLANTNDIIYWLQMNRNQQDMFPTAWSLLEKRIREHPHEAREVVGYDGNLPIHEVLWYSMMFWKMNNAAPLSLVQLLIRVHPDGLHFQGYRGGVPLHHALHHPCIDCFRAILYNGGVEATTIQTSIGRTPLHGSASGNASLVTLWELLCFNHDCITIQDSVGRTALELLEYRSRHVEEQNYQYRLNAKRVLLKLAANYNHVPKVPNDATITILESHPVCTVLARRLEPGRDAFILHRALEAKCPHVLVEALVQIFQDQIQQVDTNGRFPLHIALQHGLGASVRLLASKHRAAMHITDPVTERLPIEQALLNVGKNDSLENADAVDALLRANPSFLLRIV
jgi:ankyrin repeat protein